MLQVHKTRQVGGSLECLLSLHVYVYVFSNEDSCVPAMCPNVNSNQGAAEKPDNLRLRAPWVKKKVNINNDLS